MKRTYSFLVILLLMTVACEKKETESWLEVYPAKLEYAINGGQSILQVKGSGGWSISSIPSWVTLSEVSGSGTKDVTVTARPNDTGVLRKDSFLVRTADNNSIVTVKIIQSAGSAYNDYGLEVDDIQEIVLNGAALSMDSIFVKSNVQWVVEAPDWITLAWNGRNVNANGKTELSGSGELGIVAQQNISEDDRSATLIIRSTADDKTIEILVTQLGAYNVRPTKMILLANCFGCFWRYGYAVKYIYWKSFENNASPSEKSENSMRNYTLIEAKNNIISSRNNTKPSSPYELCAMGVDANGQNGKVSTTQLKMLSDQNQPLAELDEPSYDSNGWHCRITMNNYAKGYYTYSSANYSTISASDAFVAYLMQQAIKKRPDNYPLHNINLRWTINTPNVAMITWAVGINDKFSNLISRRNCTGFSSVRRFYNVDGDRDIDEVTQSTEGVSLVCIGNFETK